jgi:hypothetical protein
MQATTLAEQQRVQSLLRQLRALIQSGRQQTALLRPVWGACLLGETLTRLASTVDGLEEEMGLETGPAADGATGAEEAGDATPRNDDQDIYL